MLNEEQRNYLVSAITQLEQGVPPKKAFHLSEKVGRKSKKRSEESIKIYNRVSEIYGEGRTGKTLLEAYMTVMHEININRPKEKWIGVDAIEKIYAQFAQIRKSKAK